MRLTLRTLLAYMDDMLDPADQEELGRKIEASPFATELIHRSRDAVRRLRLSAPEPLAGESGDLHGGDHYTDANVASEYLDSILPPDEVAEFERHCLEAGPNADMLLAEAVSCHHVLTLVLGEPAEVDGDLRQRMYQMLQHSQPQQLRVEGAHRTPQLEPAATPVAPLVHRPRVDPDEASVPDYILEAARSQRASRRRMYAMMFAAAAIGGVMAFLVWPKDVREPPEVARMGNVGDVSEGVADETGQAGTGPERIDADAARSAIEAGGQAPAFDPGAAAPTTGQSDAAVTESPAGDVMDDAGAAADAGAASGALPAPTGTTPDLVLPDLTLPDVTMPDAIATAPSEGGAEPADPAATAIDPGSTAAAPSLPAAPGDAGAANTAAPDGALVGADDGALTGAADGALAGGAMPPDAITTTPGSDSTVPAPPTPPIDPTASIPNAGPNVIPTPDAGAMADAGVLAPPAPDSTMPALDGAAPMLPAPADNAAAAADDPEAAAVAAADEFGGDATALVEPAAGPKQLGAYLGLNNDLLLRFQPSDGAWERLAPRSMLAPGDRLLVLPNFRTLAVLGADINAFLGGGTEVVVTAPGGGDAGDVGLELPYGHVILNAGLNGNRVALAFGDHSRVVTLGPSSSLAVEVKRTFVPGTDPARDPAPVAVTWYLTSGKAEWNDGASDQSAEGPATWATIDGVDHAPQAIAELPDWIDREPMSNVDAGARDVIEEHLAAGQTVSISLLELTSPTGLGRRTEVRSLAGRSAAYVGEFEPLVKALADPAERARRKEQVETLRAAIARNPEAIAQIHAAFELQRGESKADDLTELLLGYSTADVGTTRDEVKQGVLSKLITWLNEDDLAYRVLASHNINEITGTSYLGGYRPEHTQRQREREMRYYWDRLEKGELTPKAPAGL